jgi:trimeric autotransporter adhesin
MKAVFLFVTALAFSCLLHAQGVAINDDGAAANANAMLDVKSNSKGVLLPRLTSAQRTSIGNTQGLLVYDSETNSFWYNTGTEWKDMGPSSGGWTVTNDFAELNFGSFSPHARISALNTSYGYGTGNLDLTEKLTIAIGKSPRLEATGGYNNIAIGDSSMQGAMNDSNNIALGKGALSLAAGGKFNIAIGQRAVISNVESNYNIGIGNLVMNQMIRSGYRNVSIGEASSQFMWEGADNVMIGFETNKNSQESYGNTGIGSKALSYNGARFSSNNTAVGFESMFSTFGKNNISMGWRSMYNGNGHDNIAIGTESMFTTNGGDITDNTRFGNSNTAVGYRTLYEATGGVDNTAIGAGATKSEFFADNTTAIGAGAVVDASNKVRIGNSSVTVIEGQVPFTVPSDGRFKFNVREDVAGLAFILKLRPVTYQFDTRRFDNRFASLSSSSTVSDEAMAMRRTGFIAQEVEEAAAVTGYDFSGVIKPKTTDQHYSLSYESFVVPLVKAVQEQQDMIKQLAEEVRLLKEEVKSLKASK